MFKVRSSSYHFCVPQWSNLPRKSIFPLAFKKLKRFQQALKTGHWTGLSTPAGVLQPKAEEVIKMGINASFTLPRFYWLQWEHLYAKSRNRWHPSDPENVSKKSLQDQYLDSALSSEIPGIPRSVAKYPINQKYTKDHDHILHGMVDNGSNEYVSHTDNNKSYRYSFHYGKKIQSKLVIP